MIKYWPEQKIMFKKLSLINKLSIVVNDDDEEDFTVKLDY